MKPARFFWSMLCALLLVQSQTYTGILSFTEAVNTAMRASGKKKADPAFYQHVLHELIRSHENVIIKFYANWCGPCKRMKKIMSDVMNTFGESVLVIDIDVDKYRVPGFTIRAIPHVLYYKNGNKVVRSPCIRQLHSVWGDDETYIHPDEPRDAGVVLTARYRIVFDGSKIG